MSNDQFKRSAFAGQGMSYNSSPDITGVIDEEFLNMPTAQQRAKLKAATGDSRFLTMPEQELHRHIENGINEMMRRPQQQGGGGADENDAYQPDPRMVEAMNQAADTNDVEMANRILRSDRNRQQSMSAARKSNVRAVPTVSTVDPRGTIHHVPDDQLPEALRAGHTIVMPMTHPGGTHGYVPLHEMRAAQQRGFKMGHKS